MPPKGTTIKRTASKLQSVATEAITGSPMKRTRTATSTTSTTSSIPDGSNDGEEVQVKKGRNTEKEPFPRDKVEPYPLKDGNDYLRIISWNVNGLKALVSNNLSTLHNLIEKHQPDILCLQETKIQENMIEDYRDLLPNYCSYWNCSTVKKGYSGTAFFLKKKTIGCNSNPNKPSTTASTTATEEGNEKVAKKKQTKLSNFFVKPTTKAAEVETATTVAPATTATTAEEDNILPKLMNVKHVWYDCKDGDVGSDSKGCCVGEGRTITIEFEDMMVVGCYVPNAGDGLVRLDYRINEWDPFMRNYLTTLAQQKPIIFTGDLNVGHLDVDIHNPTAKHIVKQAGLTPQERTSFSHFLHPHLPFQDVFRFFYPTAQGQFTYWSARTFARKTNHGLRLDYFVVSDDLFPTKKHTDDSDDANGDGDGDGVRRTEVVSEEGNKGSSTSSSKVVKVYDSYIIHNETVGVSDHCPVMLVLSITTNQSSK